MRDAGRAAGAGRRGRVRVPTRVGEAGGGATATARVGTREDLARRRRQGLPLIITIAFIEMGSSPTIATATVPTPTTAIRAKSPTPEEMGGRRGPPKRGWDAALPSCKDREIWSSQVIVGGRGSSRGMGW
ncbi:hypothetical protein OsI_23424 [Oryza sativa Indica Group]|uniref:Uncharacterized protein n=1 Tax=Oryza sativa subsp. indica TaxID=39946 RepID=B8B3T6_ORYSI|nr:hypothetical protein OsI_23424 [Oryza sativa Indica Group]